MKLHVSIGSLQSRGKAVLCDGSWYTIHYLRPDSLRLVGWGYRFLRCVGRICARARWMGMVIYDIFDEKGQIDKIYDFWHEFMKQHEFWSIKKHHKCSSHVRPHMFYFFSTTHICKKKFWGITSGQKFVKKGTHNSVLYLGMNIWLPLFCSTWTSWTQASLARGPD